MISLKLLSPNNGLVRYSMKIFIIVGIRITTGLHYPNISRPRKIIK